MTNFAVSNILFCE